MPDNGELERALAAIVAADIVGYSKMMGADEAGTLAAVKSLRKNVIEPGIKDRRGHLIKTTGDGFLIQFASVVDAFLFSSSVQEELQRQRKEQNSDSSILLRIGINVGEIIFDDGDIYGDGVNIAARLESLAEPGHICVSDRAWADLKRIRVDFEDMGKKKLKNIKDPIHVYQFGSQSKGASAGATEQRRPGQVFNKFRMPSKRTGVALIAAIGAIAILAFIPFGSSSKAQIEVLEFRSRSSNIPQVDIESVADEISSSLRIDAELQKLLASADLNISRLYVGGAARRVGDDIHYDVRLSETEGLENFFSIPVVRPAAEIGLAPQQISVAARDFVKCVARLLGQDVQLTPDARQAVYRYCAGLLNSESSVSNDYQNSRVLADKAPLLSQAWSALALQAAIMHEEREEKRFYDEATTASAKASQLDPNNSEALLVRSYLLSAKVETDYDMEVEKLLRAASDMSLTSCTCELTYLGSILLATGRVDEAVAKFSQAYQQSLLDPRLGVNLANALLVQGSYAEAYNLLNSLREVWPSDHQILHASLDAAVGVGDLRDAEKLIMSHENMPEHPISPLQKRASNLLMATLHGEQSSRERAIKLFEEIAAEERTSAFVILALIALDAHQKAADAAVVGAIEGEDPTQMYWPDLPQARTHTRAAEAFAKLGLIDFWRKNHVTPDFCKEEQDAPTCGLIKAS